MTSQVGLIASVIKNSDTPLVFTQQSQVSMSSNLISYFRDSSLGQFVKSLFNRETNIFEGEGYELINPYEDYDGSMNDLTTKNVREA